MIDKSVNENSSRDEQNIRTVAVYSGAHPAHQKMLAGCCTDSIKMLGEWSTDKHASGKKKLLAYASTAWQLRSSTADVIIIEGTTPSIIMAPLIKFLNCRPISIVALCAEDGIYRAFVADRGFRAIFTRLGFGFISGIIAIGDIITKLAKKHLRPLPVETRYPEVSEDRLASLTPLGPSLDSHNILLIGGRDAHYKGVDVAIACLDILRPTFPDARLTVLGFPDLEESPGLNSPGPVDDIGPYLSSSSILIHPGRGEAFGIVAVEAMLAGVIPFVSEWTGALSIAQEVEPKLVVPLKADEFAERIAALWDAPSEQRQSLSEKCKRVARDFTIKTAAQPSLAPFIEHIAHINKSRG